MSAQDVVVDSHHALVVHCSEIQEPAPDLLRFEIHLSAVPDAPLIVIQFVALRIPVAGNGERGCVVKIIFDEGGFVFVEMPVCEIPLLGLLKLHLILVDPGIHRIHNIVPLAAKGYGFPPFEKIEGR